MDSLLGVIRIGTGLALTGLTVVRVFAAALGFWMPEFDEGMALLFAGCIGGTLLLKP